VAYSQSLQQNADPLLQRLLKLYKVLVTRLSTTERLELLAQVTNTVEQRLASANTFLPFIWEEPETSVVSSAALSFAVLMQNVGHDSLSGPRYLASAESGIRRDEHVHIGTVIGLLLLGDRRVLPLLGNRWLLLSQQGGKNYLDSPPQWPTQVWWNSC
jgi:hypothetical protein